MSIGRLSLLVSFVAIAGGACAGDGTAPDDGNGNTGISFSGDVQPIFDNNCAFSGCHGSSNPQPAVKPMVLVAGQAHGNIVNVASGELPTMDRIEPGQPDDSYLIHKVQGTQGDIGGSGARMPLNGCCLTDVQIETIRTWVESGAADN